MKNPKVGRVIREIIALLEENAIECENGYEIIVTIAEKQSSGEIIQTGFLNGTPSGIALSILKLLDENPKIKEHLGIIIGLAEIMNKDIATKKEKHQQKWN